MSKYISIYIILTMTMLVTVDVMASSGRQVDNTAFDRGELLVFRAMYNSRLTGNVVAGDATLEVQHGNALVGGRPTMHIVGTVQSRGLFNLFFKVENRYDSYIDERSMSPRRFSRQIREGRYRRIEDVTFDHNQGLAISNRGATPIPPYVQDIISAFYYARTFDLTDVKPGDTFEVDFHLSDSVYVSRILFEGRELITTRLGTFKTLKFKPQVQEGAVFGQPYPMTLWISDDKNKVPILVESGLVVGSVRLELTEFRGLRNPITSFVPPN